METIAYSLESRDFMEMEHALSAWEHRYRQISPGAFHGSLLHTQVGSLGIFRNRWGRGIHFRGVAPEGTIGLAITLAQSAEGRWMGQRMGPDDVIVLGCGEEGEYHSASLWDSVVFAIPETELMQDIADITQEDSRYFLGHRAVRFPPQVSAQVRQAATTYLGVATRSLATPEAPSPLPQLAKQVVGMVARALVAADPRRQAKSSLNRQRQLIRKAEDYVVHLTDQPLRIRDLCRAININERTLRDAFYKVTDTSPLAYLKTQQLNRVYRVLHDAEPDKVLIKQVAYANGFTHLGQFSRDYKQMFSELPSVTLRS